MGPQTRSVSSRTLTLATATISPFSDPYRQQSSQAVILARSAVIALSWRPLLSWRLIHFWHCLHSCRPHALSPFKFTQQSTSLPSCLLGKNIFRVILFEWVILFKNQTVIVFLIGNYIHRVNVIKGSPYS